MLDPSDLSPRKSSSGLGLFPSMFMVSLVIHGLVMALPMSESKQVAEELEPEAEAEVKTIRLKPQQPPKPTPKAQPKPLPSPFPKLSNPSLGPSRNQNHVPFHLQPN